MFVWRRAWKWRERKRSNCRCGVVRRLAGVSHVTVSTVGPYFWNSCFVLTCVSDLSFSLELPVTRLSSLWRYVKIDAHTAMNNARHAHQQPVPTLERSGTPYAKWPDTHPSTQILLRVYSLVFFLGHEEAIKIRQARLPVCFLVIFKALFQVNCSSKFSINLLKHPIAVYFLVTFEAETQSVFYCRITWNVFFQPIFW